MERTEYAVLALYAPINEGDEPLFRHIAQVSTDADYYDGSEDWHDHAVKTAPAGALYLATICTLPVKNSGYAATMARVNVGTPGIPA